MEPKPIIVTCPNLDVLFAAELFSKLSKENQIIIVEQIKALLSLEE